MTLGWFNWEGEFICVGEIELAVPAGESRDFGFIWSPFTNYGAPGAIPLAPGEYEVFAGFAGEPLRPPFSDPVTIRVSAE